MSRSCRAIGRATLAAALALGLLAGCAAGDRAAVPGDDEAPLVLATVAPIADLVARVAGQAARVEALVPPGVDSHTFEPAPGDAARLSRTRLFVANGLYLEEPALALASANLPDDGRIVRLAELTIDQDDWVFDRSFPAQDGVPNPHLWMNPVYAIAYVEQIAAALAEAVPGGAEVFAANAADLVAQLEALDAAIAEAAATIPEAHRRLVTYHDSWAYFGPRYGLEVLDAVETPDLREPSAAQVRELIDEIRAHGVPAVFGSEVFPSEVLRTVARETGTTFVGDLADDELPGRPGDPEHSYVGMMLHNARTIVAGLGGDPSALDRVDPAVGGAQP